MSMGLHSVGFTGLGFGVAEFIGAALRAQATQTPEYEFLAKGGPL